MSSAITGQEASWTISPIRSSAWSEERPSPTSATSGCALIVAPTSFTSTSRDHLMTEPGDDPGHQLEAVARLVRDQDTQMLEIVLS